MLFPSVTRTNPKAIYQIFKKKPQKTMVLSNDLGIVLPEEVFIAVFNRMKEWHLCTIRLKKVQHWLRNINPNFWYRHKDISSLPELTGRRIRRYMYFYKMCGWRNGNLQFSGSLHPWNNNVWRYKSQRWSFILLILRASFPFKGYVMSDWWLMYLPDL